MAWPATSIGGDDGNGRRSSSRGSSRGSSRRQQGRQQGQQQGQQRGSRGAHPAKRTEAQDSAAAVEPCPGGSTRLADLRAALSILRRVGHPRCLLMGDFNFGAQPELFPTEHAELLRQREWRDAWLEANATHPGWTWDNRRNPLNKRDEVQVHDEGGELAGRGLSSPLRSASSPPRSTFQLVEEEEDDQEEDEEMEDERKDNAQAGLKSRVGDDAAAHSAHSSYRNGRVSRQHTALNFPSGRIDRIFVRGDDLHVASALLVNDVPLSEPLSESTCSPSNLHVCSSAESAALNQRRASSPGVGSRRVAIPRFSMRVHRLARVNCFVSFRSFWHCHHRRAASAGASRDREAGQRERFRLRRGAPARFPISVMKSRRWCVSFG